MLSRNLTHWPRFGLDLWSGAAARSASGPHSVEWADAADAGVRAGGDGSDRRGHRRHLHRRGRGRHRTGDRHATKTPSTPADPAEGFLAGIDKILGLIGATPETSVGPARHDGGDQPAARGQGRRRSASSPPRATSRCWRSPGSRPGRIRKLLLLGEAGPDRAGRPGQDASAGGWTSPGPRSGRSTRRRAAGRPGGSGARGIAPWACASCTPTRTTPTSGDGERDRGGDPGGSGVVVSEVLPEYREYERSMTTLVDAAVKPRVAATSRASRGGWTHLDGSGASRSR